MKYLLLIADDESVKDDPDRTAAYMAWVEEAGSRGVLVGGERLHQSSDATTVRVRNDELLVADGPFAETKEQIAGYFVIDVAEHRRRHQGGGNAARRLQRRDRDSADWEM